MPEGGITRARVRDHLRRLWAIYLIAAVLALFLNHLVYTVTRPAASDDETLRIMVLNANLSIDEQALLARTEHLGFRAAEAVPLAAAGDATGNMLLTVQLAAGFGDVYIADDGGMALLQERNACLDGALRTQGGLNIIAMRNGTTPQRALDALPIIAELIAE